MPDMINKPPHYNQGKIEVIDAIEDWRLDYHEGNVVKYIARAKHKGDELENLKKAQWYLNRVIEKKEKRMGASKYTILDNQCSQFANCEQETKECDVCGFERRSYQVLGDKVAWCGECKKHRPQKECEHQRTSTYDMPSGPVSFCYECGEWLPRKTESSPELAQPKELCECSPVSIVFVNHKTGLPECYRCKKPADEACSCTGSRRVDSDRLVGARFCSECNKPIARQ